LFRELGERGKLDLFDTLQDIRALAELDDESFSVSERCCSQRQRPMAASAEPRR